MSYRNNNKELKVNEIAEFVQWLFLPVFIAIGVVWKRQDKQDDKIDLLASTDDVKMIWEKLDKLHEELTQTRIDIAKWQGREDRRDSQISESPEKS